MRLIKKLKKFKSTNDFLSIFFFTSIVVGSFLNMLSNRTYQYDSWTIGEWLINYQGGFVRRGLLGETIYFLSNSLKISPIFLIWFICIFSYFLLIKLIFNEAKNKVSKVFLLSPGVLLAPIIGDFLIRKDILLMLIFLIILKICKHNDPNILILNVLNILGILIHESFAIYTFPIEIIILNIKPDLKSKNKIFIFNILPSFLVFALCLIFKGDIDQAKAIHQSWTNISNLFPFETINSEVPLGAINAIGWEINNAIELMFISLRNFENFVWVPLAWLLTVTFLAIFFLGDQLGRDIKIKSFILTVQFVPFSLLCFSGWDYGRWIFIWIFSSIIIYSLFGEEFNSLNFIKKKLNKFDFLEKILEKMKIQKRSKFLLVVFAYPHCCWSIYYLPGLFINLIYSILQSKKLIFDVFTKLFSK